MPMGASNRQSAASSSTRGRKLLLLYLIVGVIALPFGYMITSVLGIRGPMRLPVSILLGGLPLAILAFMLRAGHGAVERITLAALPLNRRDATPPVILSQAQALVAKGDMTAATSLYDALIGQYGYDEALCRDAVSFHSSRGGSPRRAEAILRAMRTAQPKMHELYATQRLVDLYLGALQEPAKAISELRRMAERYPGTREAEGAIVAIRNLRDSLVDRDSN
ncbi:MAG: hypothetical protein V4617_09675 [Gemmatimonadota bacterium]